MGLSFSKCHLERGPFKMMSRGLLRGCQQVLKQAKRNFGVTAACYQQADPIQELFLTKIRDYAQKSKSQPDGLVDATPALQATLKARWKSWSDSRANVPNFLKYPTLEFGQFKANIMPEELAESVKNLGDITTSTSPEEVDEEVEEDPGEVPMDVYCLPKD